MRQRSLLLLVLMVQITFAGVHSAHAEEQALDVLIIDGQNNHDWRATTPVLKDQLERTGRFSVDVLTVENRSDWENWSGSFSDYDTLLMNYYGDDWPDRYMSSFVQYVKNGGGLAVYHAAVATFKSSKPYNRMIGLGWRGSDFGARLRLNKYGSVHRVPAGKGPGAGHSSQHTYPVTVQEPDHPITKNLPGTWMHTKDELYYGLRGPARNMRILASGYADETGAHEPLLWTVPFGNGRVFVTALGHDTTSIGGIGFKVTLARGLEWSATGEVSLPVPYNVPGTDQVESGTPAWPDQGGVARSTVRKHIDDAVEVHGPFSAVKLPIDDGVSFHNPTLVTPGPEGTMFGANFTGEIYRLVDTDGDGLEDTAKPFVNIRNYGRERYPNKDHDQYDNVPEGPGLRYPTGMVYHEGWLYVATTQEIARFKDTNGDGQAETYESFASGWPYTMHYFDWTMGLRVGPDGWFYTNLSTDYLNQNREEDPRNLRGSMIRISPDGDTIDRFATGLRWAYDLAFNQRGDLFFTDNKGGGNPTEELNYAVEGGNYGHNPHGKPEDVRARDPIHAIQYGAGSTGITFNPADNKMFGETAGDAFITMWGHDGQWDHGSVVRVDLEKKDKTYEANEFRVTEGPPKVTDLSFGPHGTLYVAQFGIEGNTHTPYRDGPMGAYYRYFYTPWKPSSTDERDGALPNPLMTQQTSGDVETGEQLFQKRTCATCHTVDGSGDSLGPDLMGYASRIDRKNVIDQIRNPSRTVKSGYETFRVKKKDGSTVQGRMITTSEEHVALMVPGNKKVQIPNDQIKDTEIIDQSLMPSNLLSGLSTKQVNHLLAYLESLGHTNHQGPEDEPGILRINVGGENIVGPNGNTYRASRTYSKGGYGVIGGNAYENPDLDHPLLRTSRFGSNMEFRADADPGTYRVTLVTTEPYFEEASKRTFGVQAEGKTILDELDPLKTAGFGKPVKKTFTVTVQDGTLNIGFLKRQNHPLLAAIEIRRVEEEKK